MALRELTKRFGIFLGVMALILPGCLAAIAAAFLLSNAILRLQPAQLTQPASLLWLLLFLALVCTFVGAFGFVAKKVVASVQRRLSASRAVPKSTI
jgi:hypothetical protein